MTVVVPFYPSWLCPTAAHRERFLDMQQRVRVARLVTILCGLAVMLAFVAPGGWIILVMGPAMVLIVSIGGSRLERRRRPELWVFYSTVINIQVMVTVGAALTGGPRTALSSALAAPVMMMGARFSNRGLIVGTPISLALVVVATVGVDPTYVARHPESVLVPLTLVIITAAYLSPLVASDLRHRATSSLDPLTGLLNRRALQARFGEVIEQAALNGQPVSVVALDIDHFKAINDEHGHAAGDQVLREFSDALRRTLRTFELLYRTGGEEFLLLLPGASADDAATIAESLRETVARARPLGLALTCSFGIATAQTAINAKALTKQADAALYLAKSRGRNRVEPQTSTTAAAA